MILLVDITWHSKINGPDLKQSIENAKKDQIKGSIEEIRELDEEYFQSSTLLSRDISNREFINPETSIKEENNVSVLDDITHDIKSEFYNKNEGLNIKGKYGNVQSSIFNSTLSPHDIEGIKNNSLFRKENHGKLSRIHCSSGLLIPRYSKNDRVPFKLAVQSKSLEKSLMLSNLDSKLKKRSITIQEKRKEIKSPPKIINNLQNTYDENKKDFKKIKKFPAQEYLNRPKNKLKYVSITNNMNELNSLNENVPKLEINQIPSSNISKTDSSNSNLIAPEHKRRFSESIEFRNNSFIGRNETTSKYLNKSIVKAINPSISNSTSPPSVFLFQRK